MQATYPTPKQIGVKLPADLIEHRFNAGFDHALKGGHLTQVQYFRRSFRLGFRCAKLYLRNVRRRRGIVEFLIRGRIRLCAIWDG